jgi:hypothetical protein
MSVEGNKFEPAAATNLLALFVFDDWERVKDLLGVLQKDMKAALRTAVRQTGQWANREGARGLAKAVGVPLSILRASLRFKFSYQSFGGGRYSTARLWYGFNSIDLKYLGAKQGKRGVRSRGNTYAGAFIVQSVSPGNEKKKNMIGRTYARKTSARTPLKKVEHKIADKGNAFLTDFETKVAAKFVELFFAALDKAGGREAGESAAIAGSLNIARA